MTSRPPCLRRRRRRFSRLASAAGRAFSLALILAAVGLAPDLAASYPVPAIVVIAVLVVLWRS